MKAGARAVALSERIEDVRKKVRWNAFTGVGEFSSSVVGPGHRTEDVDAATTGVNFTASSEIPQDLLQAVRCPMDHARGPDVVAASATRLAAAAGRTVSMAASTTVMKSSG